MSLVHESDLDDQRLVRYLLGLLPDADTERLDELTIAEDEVADRLRAVEDDLVDDYVRGTLTGEPLERFESVYLASPRRREKVSFARSFLHSVARAADSAAQGTRDEIQPPQAKPAVATPSPAWPVRRLASRSWSRPTPGSTWIVAAAAALLLVTSGTLLVQDLRLRTILATAQNERGRLERRAQELEQQLKVEGEAHDKALAELNRVNASLAALEQAAAAVPPTAGSGALTATMALVLMPQTRAAGPIATVAIPPGTDRAVFELRLESNDFPAYLVALKDPGTNRILWQSVQLTVASPGAQPSVTVSVPANLLKPQHYSFELSGRNAAGRSEILASYAVQVVSR
jgi:hypothetical protein